MPRRPPFLIALIIIGREITVSALREWMAKIGASRSVAVSFLGKVKTVEFALGAVGISEPRGTPWNPWDAAAKRIPGGSSSGPAVAVAACLC